MRNRFPCFIENTLIILENMIQTEEVVENYFLDISNDYYFKLSASGFKLLNSEKYPCSHDEKASRNDVSIGLVII